MDEPKHVAKRWHEAYDDIMEAYTPSKQLPPERDSWIQCGKRYLYRSKIQLSALANIDNWVESNDKPMIRGSFFIRENLEDGEGSYEVIPITSIKSGPIVVKRYVAYTYYRLGAPIDPCNNPNGDKVIVHYCETEPKIDRSFLWNPD